MTPTILIFANCQGEELLLTGGYLPSLIDRAAFKWIPYHLATEADWATRWSPAFFADVAEVWEQVETGPPTLDRVRLRERVPAGVPTIKFPPLTAQCLWPMAGRDPRAADDPERYPWGDAVGAMLAGADLPDDALFDEYMRISAERMPDLERRLRFDIARWKAVDALSDIAMAEWVERNFRSVRLFHTAGHLTAAASARLTKQLLARSGVLDRNLVQAALTEIDLLLRRHGGQDCESVPLHPLVGERLGLAYYRPDHRYRWRGHEWTFRQYILRYIRWAPYLM